MRARHIFHKLGYDITLPLFVELKTQPEIVAVLRIFLFVFPACYCVVSIFVIAYFLLPLLQLLLLKLGIC